jgi:hypothetical protein
MQFFRVSSLAILLTACGGGDPNSGEGGTTGGTTAGGGNGPGGGGGTTTVETADTAAGGGASANPFDATNVAFEFDGILSADGTLGGYWFTDSAHEFPNDWNPPRVEVRFADEVLFDGEPNTDQEVEDHTCYVQTEFVNEPIDSLENENAAELHQAYDGWLNMFYYDDGAGGTTFTDCPDELDEDTWGAEGRDLWQPFDGARFSMGLGAMSETDLRAYWGDYYAEYQNSLVALYVSVNRLDDTGAPYTVASALTSCIMFKYDAGLEELIDEDGDGNLDLLDVSGTTTASQLPEGYARCFAYYWPETGSIDLENLADGASGGPDRDTGA